MVFLLAALTLAATPAMPAAATPPSLTPPQAAALRCGVVFAMGAKMQADGKPVATNWPPLDQRGREFFVRTAARIMEETGASRDAIQALAAAQLITLRGDGAVAAAVPGCIVLLDAAGV